MEGKLISDNDDDNNNNGNSSNNRGVCQLPCRVYDTRPINAMK